MTKNRPSPTRDPLFFELSAELAHPAPAGTAGSVLTLFYHVVLVASLSTPAKILSRYALIGTAVCMFVCAALVAFAKVEYKRR